MRALLSLGIVALVALLSLAAVQWLPQSLSYPEVVFGTPGGLVLRFIKAGKSSQAQCEENLAALRDTLAKACDTCVREARCVAGLDAEHRILLSNEPLPTPSARLPDGVVTYTASAAGLALQTCMQSEQATMGLPEARRAHCFDAGTIRQ